jgi:hypothetical protein
LKSSTETLVADQRPRQPQGAQAEGEDLHSGCITLDIYRALSEPPGRNVRLLLALIYVLPICCVGAVLFASVNKFEPNLARITLGALAL